MEIHKTNSTRTLLAALGAVLLMATPPAHAAKRQRKSSKRLAAASPAQAKSLIAAGTEHLENQRYDSAIQSFSQATKADATDSAAFFLLGYAHYQRGFRGGNPETADRGDAMETIAAYSASIALDPKLDRLNSPYRLYHSMALSYEAVESYDNAIESYRKAFALAPHNPMLPLYAARLRYRMNEMDKSTSNLALSLRKAREQKKDKVLMDLIKTNPYFAPFLHSGAHRKILKTYDPKLIAAALPAEGEEEGMGMRDAVRDVPEDQRQEIAAEAAVERPQSSAVMKQLGMADEEFQFRRFREAADAYNQTLRLNQESGALNPTQLSMVYERMGTAYNKLGLSEGAVKALQYSIQQMPFNSAAHYQLALAYSVSGRFNQSLKSLNEAFKSSPTSGELRKLMLLAKTDSELDAVRDLPGFHKVLGTFSEKLTFRR